MSKENIQDAIGEETKEADPCESEEIQQMLANWNREADRAKLDEIAVRLAEIPEEVFGKSTVSITEPLSQFLTVMNRRHGRLIRLQELCTSVGSAPSHSNYHRQRTCIDSRSGTDSFAGTDGKIVCDDTRKRAADSLIKPDPIELLGIQLSVGCGEDDSVVWRSDFQNDFAQAIEDIQNKLSPLNLNFVDVFGGLEFRLFQCPVVGETDDSGHAALTVGSDLVEWYSSNMQSGTRLVHTVVHELGHILANRLDTDTPDTIIRTAIFGSSMIPTLSFERGDVDIPKEGRGGGLESVADYFMFWVYDAINVDNSENAQIADAFLSGDRVIVWHRPGRFSFGTHVFAQSGSREDVISAISEITGTPPDRSGTSICGVEIPDTISPGLPITSNLGEGDRCEFVVVLSPGMEYWLRRVVDQRYWGG